jgi:hypothetical protein
MNVPLQYMAFDVWHNFDGELVTRFYAELMTPSFPDPDGASLLAWTGAMRG